MNIDALIEAADNALRQDPADVKTKIEKIELYSSLFAKWQEANLTQKGQAAPMVEVDPETLKTLLSKHNELMKVIETVKAESRDELAELKKKGEAIVAYSDDRSKKVSTVKPSKG
jgi:hypothetical protein